MVSSFSAVVRTPGAYVLPGSRHSGSGPVPQQPGAPEVAPVTNGTAAAPAAPAPIPTISGPAPEDTTGKVRRIHAIELQGSDWCPSCSPRPSASWLTLGTS